MGKACACVTGKKGLCPDAFCFETALGENGNQVGQHKKQKLFYIFLSNVKCFFLHWALHLRVSGLQI